MKPKPAFFFLIIQSQENTFQVVLATDGSSSFVLFLYQDIQWGTANIGFNAGDGVRGYMAPEAFTGTRIAGIRAFQVDGSQVLFIGNGLASVQFICIIYHPCSCTIAL